MLGWTMTVSYLKSVNEVKNPIGWSYQKPQWHERTKIKGLFNTKTLSQMEQIVRSILNRVGDLSD